MAAPDSRTDSGETVVNVRRCACVVKGGRRFSFAALVVTGDGNGRVGYGYGKAVEVPLAVEKATKQANRSQNRVPIVGSTIPHQVIGRFRASRVLLLPARPGTGIIAGECVRSVVESAGITDILTKSFGSSNPLNLVKATMDALQQLRTREDVEAPSGSFTVMILNDVHVGIQKYKKRKRIGRGPGSGHGKTSGRGHKGYYSRSGSSRRLGFEGGQMPLFRRIAKRGFNNRAFADNVVIINVRQLDQAFESGDEVTVEALVHKGLIPSRFDAVKILGDGDLTKSLQVQAHRFSKSAEEKISAAGGSVVQITKA